METLILFETSVVLIAHAIGSRRRLPSVLLLPCTYKMSPVDHPDLFPHPDELTP
jgi:hypothetical protein